MAKTLFTLVDGRHMVANIGSEELRSAIYIGSIITAKNRAAFKEDQVEVFVNPVHIVTYREVADD